MAPAATAPTAVTPLPTLKVAAVGAALFANQFSSMVVFPFLAFMTADFFPLLEKTQLGPYAGLLGSAFHVSKDGCPDQLL